MKLVNRIRLWLRLLFHGFFFGLRAADQTLTKQVSGEDDEINHRLEIDNVFNDMLQENETEQVQEMRDKNYRVYREADNYEVTVTGMKTDGENFDDEDSELYASASKKVFGDKPRTDLLETKNYKIVLVQDTKEYENDIVAKQKEGETGEAIDDKGTNIFDVTYKDDIIPRFYIERYINRLVLKVNDNGNYRVDLYFSQYARQFMKRDSLFIAELHRVFDGKSPKSDILAIDTLSFITDKAFGSEDLHRVTLNNFVYKNMCQYDGSFVIEFSCSKTDEDVVAKYRTKELDEKYATEAQKKAVVDINAMSRKIERDEEKEKTYEITTLKIE